MENERSSSFPSQAINQSTCCVGVVALHEAEVGQEAGEGDRCEGKAVPDLVLLLHPQAVCKAMLAALFAVKSRCSVVLVCLQPRAELNSALTG
jgi:hypothetical protein